MKKTKNNSISIRAKGTLSFEARITPRTFMICTNEERLSATSKNKEEAVAKLLKKLLTVCEKQSVDQPNLIMNDNFTIQLMDSVSKLYLTSNEIMQLLADIANVINSHNTNIREKKPENNCNYTIHSSSLTVDSNKYDKYSIVSVALEWKKHEYNLTLGSSTNVNPLSNRTVDDEIRYINQIFLPFCKIHNKEFLQDLNTNFLQKLIDSHTSYDTRRLLYITLKKFFGYITSNKYMKKDIFTAVVKPPKPKRTSVKRINCIPKEERSKYMEMLKKEGSDMSLLFLVMLFTGLRPEEACGLKWSSINNSILTINSAYKEENIYNDNMEKIGKQRKSGTLKTEDSYREIPIPNDILTLLNKHKENQKKIYANHKTHPMWNSDCYMFQSKALTPYVSGSLNKGLKTMCLRYDLPVITPYYLRRTMATCLYENDTDPITAAKIMGHTHETAQKYYIQVSQEKSRNAINQVYSSIQIA